VSGGAGVCTSCGRVFARPSAHHDRCPPCHAAWRRYRDFEAGYRRGWQDAALRAGRAVDHRALAAALDALREEVAT
jgi:hypothetical protein